MYGINQGDLALNSGNYDLSYQGNNLTITKALLNVIADGLHKDMTKAEARLADNGSEQTVDRLHKDMTKAEARLADNGSEGHRPFTAVTGVRVP